MDVIAKKSNNPRWAWDCYRRFIQMYSDVVMEVGKKYFRQLIDQMKEARGVTQDVELTAGDLKELAMQFKAEYKSKIGSGFPTDPKEQLMGAIKAVFRSWDNPAPTYTAGTTTSPIPGAPPSTCSPWPSATWATTAAPAWPLPATPPPAKKLFGEFLTNAQARTWWPTVDPPCQRDGGEVPPGLYRL